MKQSTCPALQHCIKYQMLCLRQQIIVEPLILRKNQTIVEFSIFRKSNNCHCICLFRDRVQHFWFHFWRSVYVISQQLVLQSVSQSAISANIRRFVCVIKQSLNFNFSKNLNKSSVHLTISASNAKPSTFHREWRCISTATNFRNQTIIEFSIFQKSTIVSVHLTVWRSNAAALTSHFRRTVNMHLIRVKQTTVSVHLIVSRSNAAIW